VAGKELSTSLPNIWLEVSKREIISQAISAFFFTLFFHDNPVWSLSIGAKALSVSNL
jgi:hypothetical protein